MDKLLKPEKFEVLPDNPSAGKEWGHWIRTFENFIESSSCEQIDKLKVLINFISYSIYEFISECTTYEHAIRVLNEVYVKPRNEIFARHTLATRKQKMGETIDQYLLTLQVLSKECNFKSISAMQYRDEYIRDSFINGLYSSYIRQRLLENKSLDLQEAINQSRALEMAQKHSDVYNCPSSQPSIGSISKDNLPMVSQRSISSNSKDYAPIKIALENEEVHLTASSQWKCFFCGNNKHQRDKCPAKDVICNSCKKKGHFAKVCRSRPALNKTDTSSPTVGATSATIPGLSKAITKVKINRIVADSLIDTGSSESYINGDFVAQHNLKRYPGGGHVSMASTSFSTQVKGYVIVNLVVQQHEYTNFKLAILPQLCSDILIGHDLLKLHSNVEMKFGGSRPPLSICSMAHAKVESPRLFRNLDQSCRPVAVKSRRYSEADMKIIESEVTKLLAEEIIEESASPWRAQVLIIKNENHKRRMVIDYSQTVNKFTLLDAYPLPNIEQVVSRIAQYKIYSVVDLRSAYHQIALREEEKVYTAFEANGRLYQFKRIPFGVTNGVACFQRVIDKLISEERLNGVFAYIDDITVCGKNQVEHDENLTRFLAAAKKYGLTLNENKCRFAQESIALLGHLINHKNIRPDPERLAPLLNLPVPQNASSLKRVIGMFSHYSKWVPKFSEKIHSLVACQSFPMSSKTVADFERIKRDIADSVVNSITQEDMLVVESDASDFAIAATLSQRGRPVAFFSRTLNNCEKRHPAIEKEACAIVEAIRKWKHYLTGRHFKLITDQQALSFMFNIKNSSKIKNDKIMRWRLELSCYKFDISYRPGKDNTVADTFSRVCGASSTDTLYNLHHVLCHPGITRMLHWIRSKNLPYSLEDVKRMTAACSICAEVKPRFFKNNEGHLIKATVPFERLSLDFKGPLPSNSGNRYILTIIDEYSRFPFAFPCRDLSSASVINCLLELFVMFGTPSYIHSDRGTSFLSRELTSFLHARGIATSFTTPYNPEGNGQVERYNGIIWKTVMLALNSRKWKVQQWQEVLPEALHSIRSLLCTAINCAPHERFFKHNRRSPNGTSLPSWLTQPGPVLVKRHVRASKYEPLVEEAELLEANPEYALIRRNDGRQTTVSLKHLAPPGDRDHDTVTESVPDTGSSETRNSTEVTRESDRKSPSPQSVEVSSETNRHSEPQSLHNQTEPEHRFPTRQSVRIRSSPKYLEDYFLFSGGECNNK